MPGVRVVPGMPVVSGVAGVLGSLAAGRGAGGSAVGRAMVTMLTVAWVARVLVMVRVLVHDAAGIIGRPIWERAGADVAPAAISHDWWLIPADGRLYDRSWDDAGDTRNNGVWCVGNR
jgi:hypothetical protein